MYAKPMTVKDEQTYLREYLEYQITANLDNPHTVVLPWVALSYIVAQLQDHTSKFYDFVCQATTAGYRFSADADDFYDVALAITISEIDHEAPFHIWFQRIFSDYGQNLVIEPIKHAEPLPV